MIRRDQHDVTAVHHDHDRRARRGVTAESLEYHEWIPTGELVKANHDGKRNPKVSIPRWAEVTCNNTACRAYALVDVGWAAQLAAPAYPDRCEHPNWLSDGSVQTCTTCGIHRLDPDGPLS